MCVNNRKFSSFPTSYQPSTTSIEIFPIYSRTMRSTNQLSILSHILVYNLFHRLLVNKPYPIWRPTWDRSAVNRGHTRIRERRICTKVWKILDCRGNTYHLTHLTHCTCKMKESVDKTIVELKEM